MTPAPASMYSETCVSNIAVEKSKYLNSEAVKLLKALLGTDDPNDTFYNPSSVYSRVKHFTDESNDKLDPAPLINSALGDLVTHLQGRSTKCTSSFAALEQAVCTYIDNSEDLTSKAAVIRNTAERAESRLEVFYAKILLESSCANARNGESYVDRVAAACDEFPYTSNYAVVVAHEAELLQQLIGNRTGRELHVVFCGSGPLPLTGVLLAARLQCAVTLVDCDAQAVRLSTRLVARWERLGVVPLGLIRVVLADGGDVQFTGRAHTDVDEGQQDQVEQVEGGMVHMRCDVVFIAALIPNDVKEKMVESMCAGGEPRPLVALRSAHGLTARMAYFHTRRSVLSQYVPLVATAVPETHKLGNGRVVDDDVIPTGFFPRQILNSIEIYGRVAR